MKNPKLPNSSLTLTYTDESLLSSQRMSSELDSASITEAKMRLRQAGIILDNEDLLVTSDPAKLYPVASKATLRNRSDTVPDWMRSDTASEVRLRDLPGSSVGGVSRADPVIKRIAAQ